MEKPTPNYLAREADENGRIDYPPAEHAVWHDLIVRQQANLPGRACQEYLDGLAKLQLPHDRIPQLPDIDAVLQAATGWRTAAVPALISFGRFFGLLADKAFPVATFIRRREDFDYIQEPDIFHEIAGHCPLLTHPAFAAFNETYGRLGLAADKEERVFLARLYWFTIEFGLVGSTPENRRIYGGGILSSPSETEYALSGRPEYRAFDIGDVLRTPYRIDRIQPIYYVIDNIDQLFTVAESDIMGHVRRAMRQGLFAPHPSLLDKQAV
ncbi:phenylalanine 4-monooxygenase [Neisseria leonii]|uniref:phenylalanine 4-monooxygenase n=1 Tax=Neisseria leonii TaxID=2995413 RepID=UPI00237AB640|nr:phenylalanine 4-monooxygenase [Neisseria sp. 3986]MDD9325789.1 phenylalanine 4-monooxygenase [Neisseria sp. 3986]